MNLDYFFAGIDTQAYKYMGCHKLGNDVEFYVWAPHARKVEVFTSREDFRHFYEMEKVDNRGIWHLIIKDCECIYSYRYRITTPNGQIIEKSDPYAFYSERRPANASVMYDVSQYKFTDNEYMEKRNFSYSNPLNIYEIHVNGFKHEGELTTYRELKEELIPYVKQMGYTHIEMMPITEYPFDGSWGYQATGFLSVTSRYGTPWDLMDFVNECHLNNIGVILDVSYVHFATDSYGLCTFDGKPCYEYEDPKLSRSQWGSYQFNLGSGPVISYLMSSANIFLNEYHFDGLRMDAVSNIIFFDGNKNIGENTSGLSFVKRFNYSIKKEHPDVMLIAEDSTDYPHVTVPTEYDGLGFDYKWDLGWMNDTLKYYMMDPEYRQYHHNMLTFSMAYFYSEKFILPLSHDEVVHSKKTIVDKMWGSQEDQFRMCRNLFLYMFTHPGKKLNFLGNDIAMYREFDENRGLDWDILQYPLHDSFNRYFRDLCQIYNSYKAFSSYDYDPASFRWIDADNYKQSIYIYTRYEEDYCFLIVLNMKPIPYTNFRIGVPYSGTYTELINSEKDIYSGCNMCNFKPIRSKKIKAHGLPNSIAIDLAPYAGVMFSVKTRKKAPVLEDPDLIKTAKPHTTAVKTAAKTTAKTAAKVTAKTAAKAAVKKAIKAKAEAVPKAEKAVKTAVKSASKAKTVTKTAAKTAPKAASKTAKSTAKTLTKAAAKPVAKAKAKTVSKAKAKPTVKAKTAAKTVTKTAAKTKAVTKAAAKETVKKAVKEKAVKPKKTVKKAAKTASAKRA